LTLHAVHDMQGCYEMLRPLAPEGCGEAEERLYRIYGPTQDCKDNVM